MRKKYLLPCPCGRKIPVDVGQSGQSISCPCGRGLEIPTMLAIRALARVEEESSPPPPRRAWGIRQQLVLLGMLTTVGAASLALGLYLTRPRPPKPPDLQRTGAYTERLSLLQTFGEWERLRRGLDSGPQIIKEGYGLALAAYHRWMVVLGVIGVLGAACAASSLLVPKPGP